METQQLRVGDYVRVITIIGSPSEANIHFYVGRVGEIVDRNAGCVHEWAVEFATEIKGKCIQVDFESGELEKMSDEEIMLWKLQN